MPRYDFRCPECDERFEVTRPAGGAVDICCPECGVPAKRIYTPVGMVLKGSGFHNTDYRSRPKEDSGASKSDSPKTGSTASEAPSCPAADSGCKGCAAAN